MIYRTTIWTVGPISSRADVARRCSPAGLATTGLDTAGSDAAGLASPTAAVITTPVTTLGFTLLEMIAVLTLMSLIAAASALSLKQPLQNARLQRSLGRLEDFDRRARLAARQLSSMVELKFDADTGTVRQTAIQGGWRDNDQRSIGLDRGVDIDRLLTARQSSGDGALLVQISPAGQSDTYAIRLRTGEDRHAWLLVVGATGQTIRTNEEDSVERLVSMQR